MTKISSHEEIRSASDREVSTKTDHTHNKEKPLQQPRQNGSLRNSLVKSKQKMNPRSKLTIRMPVPKGESFSENEDSSDSSVTDVSPLQSPDASPRTRSSLRAANHSFKNGDIPKVKSSNKSGESWPRARRSKGETLSINDLMYTSESGSISSSDKDGNFEKRKKVLRKKKVDHNDLHHRMEASTRHHRRRLLDVAAQNSMDISQLLEVVLEMEQEENKRKALSRPEYPKYLCHIQPPSKKNMSFSRERLRDIDTENERLLGRLTELCGNSKLRRPSSASSMRSSTSSCRTASTTRSNRRPATAMGTRARPGQGPRLYHSATNRIRDQQRIERENIAFLKRLQQTRSSNALRRDTLLHDYERKTGKVADATRPERQRNIRGSRYTGQVNQRGRLAWQDSW